MDNRPEWAQSAWGNVLWERDEARRQNRVLRQEIAELRAEIEELRQGRTVLTNSTDPPKHR